MQKQQKSLEVDKTFDRTQLQTVLKNLNQNPVPLWSRGEKQIPLVEINDNMLKALAFARRCGSLRVGLEQIQTLLQAEETGLVLMNKKSSPFDLKSNEDACISRVVLLSNDGSERFYRQCESMLNLYSHRLLGIKLNASSAVLGKVFYGRENKSVKALYVNRKDSVLRVLSSFL